MGVIVVSTSPSLRSAVPSHLISSLGGCTTSSLKHVGASPMRKQPSCRPIVHHRCTLRRGYLTCLPPDRRSSSSSTRSTDAPRRNVADVARPLGSDVEFFVEQTTPEAALPRADRAAQEQAPSSRLLRSPPRARVSTHETDRDGRAFGNLMAEGGLLAENLQPQVDAVVLSTSSQTHQAGGTSTRP